MCVYDRASFYISSNIFYIVIHNLKMNYGTSNPKMPIKKIKNKKGVVWRVRGMVNGVTYCESIKTSLSDAKAIEAKIIHELKSQTINEKLGRVPDITFGEACVRWGKEGAPKSMFSHIRNVLKFMKSTHLVDCVTEAQKMKGTLIEQGLSNLTINRRLSIVRRVLNLAYREWNWLDRPLAEKISLMSERNSSRELYLEDAQAQELLDAIDHDTARDFVKVALYTGLRKSEIMRLEQADYRNGHLHIRKSKGGRSRFVPVPALIDDICNRLPLRITESTLRGSFERARNTIGIPELRFHDLRHTYGSWMIKRGVSTGSVRDVMGHSHLAVTSKYVHSSGIDIDEVFK